MAAESFWALAEKIPVIKMQSGIIFLTYCILASYGLGLNNVYANILNGIDITDLLADT